MLDLNVFKKIGSQSILLQIKVVSMGGAEPFLPITFCFLVSKK